MLSFKNVFNNTTTMTVQNTIFTTNFVPMDSFESWTCPLGEAEKKNLVNRVAGNSAQQIQCYSSNWVRHYHYNDCAKIPFSELTYFKLKHLIAEHDPTCPFGEAEKKNLLNRAAGNSAEHIQSYLLNWVRHYHYNDCAK